MISITLELEPGDAAALKRLVEKIGHSEALAVLYTHRPRELRNEQASQIVRAVGLLDRALQQSRVSSWPWVETGEVS